LFKPIDAKSNWNGVNGVVDKGKMLNAKFTFLNSSSIRATLLTPKPLTAFRAVTEDDRSIEPFTIPALVSAVIERVGIAVLRSRFIVFVFISNPFRNVGYEAYNVGTGIAMQ
jgi:hypothetical protein